jgi:Family of unknown function (DUF6812)
MDIPEDKTKVIILTTYHRIIGMIAHFSNARLTDYMAEAKSFIAVTDAEVWNHSGSLVLTTSFLNIRRDQIEMIMPEDLATLK